MFLIGNINHPNVSFFPCVLVFKIEQEYPARVEIREVEQTACEKF